MNDHDKLLQELDSLMTGLWLSDMANFCSLFYHNLPHISWIGFYLNDGRSLKLGPFQGKVACTDIAYSRGVCGAAFSKQEILIVDDVHEFPGHIACDPASRSEIVLPLTISDSKIGVLDVDSAELKRFSEEDSRLFQAALKIFRSHHSSLSASLMGLQ